MKHLQIVQNRITKLHLNPKDASDADTNPKEKSKVVSNKSIDETDKKTKPLVTGDTEEQRYSSRVVNTEPMFVKDIDNMYSDYSVNEDTMSRSTEFNLSHWPEGGNDKDDPSSGMS